MSHTHRAHLYLITPPAIVPAAFAVDLAAALDAGDIACVRLRLRDADEEGIRRAAGALLPVCHARGAALVISDHFQLVRPLGLDGAHLEPGRNALRAARAAIGGDAILGVSGGASRHAGMNAAEAGADYVSIGPVWAAPSLGAGSFAGPELFQWWAEMIETPIVAEGGLTPERAAALAPYADFIAPRRSVWENPDGPAAAVKAYMAALKAA